MTIRHRFFAFVLLTAAGVASMASAHAATTYYVNSASGNDQFDGRLATATTGIGGPWRTLGRLAATPLQPGDRVVLACGSIWRETLKLNGSGTLNYPIIVGAPAGGCTAPPTIDGAIEIPKPSWRQVQGQVYQAEFPYVPLQLHSGSLLLTRAHHPNRGHDITRPNSPFLPMLADGDKVSAGGRVRSTSIITGGELKLPSGAAIKPGATVRIRTNAWTVEERHIVATQAGKLLLDSPTLYPAVAGWGYYLMGQAWMVDSPNEWHYDTTNSLLLAWMPRPLSTMEPLLATVLDKGVDLQGRSFITVDGLRVQRVGTGLQVRGTRGVEVRNSTIEDVAGLGVDGAGSVALVLEKNSLSRTEKDAIQGFSEDGGSSKGMVVRDNTIRDSGVLMSGETALSLPLRSFAAIYSGPDSVISGNTLINTGYIGIRYMKGSTIERNVVYGACSVLDDCGAIYTWGAETNNSVVRQNVVSRVRGNVNGKPANNNNTAAQGIYLDDYTTGVRVEQNTVVDADNGIQVHVSARNIIRNNVLYNNRRSQIWMQATTNKINSFGDVFANEVSGNLIAPVSATSVGVMLDTNWSSTSNFGNFTANRYFDAATAVAVRERTGTGTRNFTFKEWQDSSLVGSDKPVELNGYHVKADPYASSIVIGSNLLANSQFAANISGWSHWNQTAPVGQLLRERCAVGAAGYCARYIPGGSIGVVSSPNFSVQQGQWYRLTMDILAEQNGQPITLVVRRGGGGSNGYEPLADRNLGFTTGNTWRRYSVVFQAIKTVNKADAVTRDNGARVDVDQLAFGRGVTLANMELVPLRVHATVISGVVNTDAAPRAMNCPLPAAQAAECGQLVRLSDGQAAAWPMQVPAYRAELFFARNPALPDADRDGISDAQDQCPNTPPGYTVNAAGCALEQQR